FTGPFVLDLDRRVGRKGVAGVADSTGDAALIGLGERRNGREREDEHHGEAAHKSHHSSTVRLEPELRGGEGRVVTEATRDRYGRVKERTGYGSVRVLRGRHLCRVRAQIRRKSDGIALGVIACGGRIMKPFL